MQKSRSSGYTTWTGFFCEKRLINLLKSPILLVNSANVERAIFTINFIF